ncbi:hypothetical protein ABZX51_009349 [Aspergillus tubingensis]
MTMMILLGEIDSRQGNRIAHCFPFPVGNKQTLDRSRVNNNVDLFSFLPTSPPRHDPLLVHNPSLTQQDQHGCRKHGVMSPAKSSSVMPPPCSMMVTLAILDNIGLSPLRRKGRQTKWIVVH